MINRNLLTKSLIITIVWLSIISSLPINEFQEQIVIKNGTIVSQTMVQLNSTKDKDDDPTTLFTLDDEEVTRNMSTITTTTTSTTTTTTTMAITTEDEILKPNTAQRVLRALLTLNNIVIGPLDIELTGKSLFALPLVREAFARYGPLNFLQPFAKELWNTTTQTPRQ